MGDLGFAELLSLVEDVQGLAIDTRDDNFNKSLDYVSCSRQLDEKTGGMTVDRCWCENASECLRAWYRPTQCKTFNAKAICHLEKKPEEQQSEKSENTDDADEEESNVTSGEENSRTGVLNI